MESIWRKQEGSIQAHSHYDWNQILNMHWDVIVVGAGMAGLLIAYYLQEAGKRVLVLEAKTIASGQTERTTAKVTCQHGLKYHQLIQDIGKEKAQLYAKANMTAMEEYEKLIRKQGISCGWQRLPAYLYSTQNEELLQQEAAAAASLGIEAYFCRETELPFEIKGAVCFPNQAQFEPLAFVKAIAAKLEIWEHTRVCKISGQCVFTEEGNLKAEQIVLATHYPMRNVPGMYFLRQHQERSYIVAVKGAPKLKGIYYGVDASGLSLRQSGEALLVVGGSKRTGQNEEGACYEMLRTRARQLFPDFQEIAHWSAQDCMPHDGIPFIGRYSIWTPHIFVATGFSKWGMTGAMLAALLLRDRLCGRENPYARVFSPQRMNLWASVVNLTCDVGMSVKGLTKGFLHRPKRRAEDLERGEAGIVRLQGRRQACYRDEEGRLHGISARCAHLGCELTWNADEKSWDCPCHGSRFDIDGKLLDNPAKYSLTETGRKK